MKDIALILAAAGEGSRFSGTAAPGEGSRPKQCLDLLGMPIYLWSVVAFGINPQINRLVVVTRGDLLAQFDATIQNFAFQNGLTDIYDRVRLVEGGATRQESVYLGLKSLESEPPDYVLVHDAARPYICQDLINRVIASAIEYGAALPAAPVTDTIKEVEDGFIKSTLDRSRLYRAQTPQAAAYAMLLRGHQEARSRKLEVTDDAAIIELLNEPVRLVEAGVSNIKITVAEDLLNSRVLAEETLGQINALIASKK